MLKKITPTIFKKLIHTPSLIERQPIGTKSFSIVDFVDFNNKNFV